MKLKRIKLLLTGQLKEISTTIVTSVTGKIKQSFKDLPMALVETLAPFLMRQEQPTPHLPATQNQPTLHHPMDQGLPPQGDNPTDNPTQPQEDSLPSPPDKGESCNPTSSQPQTTQIPTNSTNYPKVNTLLEEPEEESPNPNP